MKRVGGGGGGTQDGLWQSGPFLAAKRGRKEITFLSYA